jgi:hypothetical protein
MPETRSASQQIREFGEPGDGDIDRFAGHYLAAAFAALVGPRHMAGAQAARRRVRLLVCATPVCQICQDA